MSFLAVPWLVLAVTGSATSTGMIAFAETAPYVAVQALAGPVLDRVGTWRVSIGSDLGAAVAVGAVSLLAASGTLSMSILAGLIACAGALRGAGDTARNVLVPGVAAAAQATLERAAGLYDGTSRLAALIGAPLAGVVLALSSTAAVLAADAISFALSAALVATLVPRTAQPRCAARRHSARESPTGYLAALREGLRWLRTDRLLVGIAAMVLITNTLDQANGLVLTPVWAADVAHSPVALGVLGGVFALGAVLGNLATAWRRPRGRRRVTYGAGFLIAGPPRFVALALASTLAPAVPIALVAGIGVGAVNPILGAVEYERIPRPLQARVLGAMGAIAWAGIPIGGLAAGVLVQHIGLRAALWIVAGVYAVTAASPFVFPVWREMDHLAGRN